MPNRIEPPILLSRLLMFVFAASIVVLAALVFTLTHMFPLNRAEVFFLTTRNPNDLQVMLTEMPPNDSNMETYKRMFIREYIKARNEIFPNAKVMARKWNVTDGAVKILSTDDVFADFTRTEMWNDVMSDGTAFDFSCRVEFRDTGPTMREYTTDGMTYLVDFVWFCTNSYGQTDKKTFTIKIRLAYDDGAARKYSDRLENPLGIRVAEYSVQSGDGDPLDILYMTDDVE